MGRGSVQAVLTFYSDNQSLNPAEAYTFSVQCVFEKNKNKQKEAGVGHFLKAFNFTQYLFLGDIDVDFTFLI